MKRIALLALLLGSCGPSRREEILPRYAILTTFGSESAMYPSVRWLAERRFAQIRQIRPQPSELALVRSWLREFDPTYVAVVLRPEDLDTNFHLAFLDLACRLDDDPFPDFAFGYFPAADPATLQRQMKNLQGVEAKIEKKLLRITRLEVGAEASAESGASIAWATDLPERRLALKAGDAEFLRKNLDAVERCDFLLLSGTGTPHGLRGLAGAEIQKLKLDSTVVFSSADATGAVGAGFDAEGGLVRRWTVPPDRSVVLNLARAGAAAVIAPLGKTRPDLAEFEWSDAVLSDAPLGWAVKHGYDLAILQAGAPPPVLSLVEPRRPPAGFEDPIHQAATRVLFGDPLLKPFSRPVRRPVEHVRTVASGRNDRGETLWDSVWRVSGVDCPPYLKDPAGGERIYVKIAFPRGLREARAELRSAKARERDVPAALAAQALEEWRGDPILHVLLRGAALGTEDLFIHLGIATR
jgi:hypothetical protein